METRGHRRLHPRQRSTRRVTFLSLLLLAVVAPAGFVLAGESSQPYIVVFDSDAMAVATSATPNGLVVHASVPTSASATTGEKRDVDETRVRRHVAEIEARTQVRAGNVYTNAMGGFSANLTGSQLRALERDASVAAIVPDEQISLDVTSGAPLEAGGIRTTTSPTERVPAGVRRVGAQRSTIASFTGQDSRVNADVAIIDTGIQRDHPDLNVVGGYNCTGRNRDKWDDVDGHGTHVAGIVGALDNRIGVTGVAPGARLWSVKVLGPHGSGMLSWLVCGIDWVTSQRERGNSARPLFEVANMSISFSLPGAKDGNCGAERHDAVHLAICRSVSKGTVYVVAAGNESHNARLNRPAAYGEVITVSALADYDGRGGGRASGSDNCPYWTSDRDDAFTSFSNWGPDVDLIAPGRCVLSTYKRSRYAWMSGTSMATPHVTGAVALYRSAYPRATPHQVRLALEAVATTDWRTTSDPDRTHEKAVWVGAFRTMPDFRVSAATTAPRPAPGGDAQLSVAVTRVGGFEDAIALGLSNPPSGFRANSVSTTGSSATITMRIDSSVGAGHYTLTVRGFSGDVERLASVAIDVQADTTAPRAPSVSLSSAFAPSSDPSALRVSNSYLGRSGMLWVRGGTTGTVDLVVSGFDGESGIASNSAVLHATGWRASWTGDPAGGALRLSYTTTAANGTLAVTSINGAGLAGRATNGTLMTDSKAPTPAEWVSSPADTTLTASGLSFTLDWIGGSDSDSGLADRQSVQRYRTSATATGACRISAWKVDGAQQLRVDGSRDTDLEAGYCYAWALRTLDNVGNAAPINWSGFVVVRDRP